MRASINDPQYWQERADEARSVADQLADKGAKAAMHRVAESYLQLAKAAALRLMPEPSPPGKTQTDA